MRVPERERSDDRAGAALAPALCPECGRRGRLVERVTVKALLRPAALARLGMPAHHFCSTPTCGVVYFADGERFEAGDVSVPVFEKEPPGDRIVCYCFGVSQGHLREEIARHGGSGARDRIGAHVEAGRCACTVKNPEGRCCLGHLDSAVREALGAAGLGTAGSRS